MRYFLYAVAFGLLILVGCAPAVKQNNAEAHYKLGISYMGTGDPTIALREFLKAEEIEPDDADLQAALGEAYLAKKIYSEAEKHFELALELDPENPKLQNNLAAVYVKMERYDDAIEYFHLAASNYLFPRPEVSWTGIGYAQFKKEDYPAALKAFENAIAANWRFPAAYVGRGEVYHALSEFDKALAEYDQALDLAPASSIVHYNMALTYLKKRNKDQAISHLESVVNLAPDSDLSRQAKAFLSVLQ